MNHISVSDRHVVSPDRCVYSVMVDVEVVHGVWRSGWIVTGRKRRLFLCYTRPRGSIPPLSILQVWIQTARCMQLVLIPGFAEVSVKIKIRVYRCCASCFQSSVYVLTVPEGWECNLAKKTVECSSAHTVLTL